MANKTSNEELKRIAARQRKAANAAAMAKVAAAAMAKEDAR